jgi:hypothetical protein
MNLASSDIRSVHLASGTLRRMERWKPCCNDALAEPVAGGTIHELRIKTKGSR